MADISVAYLEQLKVRLTALEEDYKRRVAAIIAEVNERYLKELRDELTTPTKQN